MRALVIAVLATVSLAGCASDEPPPPLSVGEPTYSDAEVPPGVGLAPLEWRTLAESAFTLAPAQSFSAPVTIPNGSIATYVNLTLETGAAYGLGVQMSSCLWEREMVLTQGQEIVADCGGLLEGPDAVHLSTDAGALTGVVRVVSLVCTPSMGRCPGRLPAAN